MIPLVATVQQSQDFPLVYVKDVQLPNLYPCPNQYTAMAFLANYLILLEV
jgi:hypothetical protein